MTIKSLEHRYLEVCTLLFRSSHFSFLVTFGDEVMKIRKYYVIFVYILQGKMGKTGKKRKENHATKVTKIPKTKRRKYGMNETKVKILWEGQKIWKKISHLFWHLLSTVKTRGRIFQIFVVFSGNLNFKASWILCRYLFCSLVMEKSIDYFQIQIVTFQT